MANALPIKATTQDHLEIEDIINDLVLLKDGTVALILQTTALNFGLLSEPEQDAVIYAYAALLNSLNFSIQVVIRSKRSDVSEYIKSLSAAENAQANPSLRKQMKNYREFILSTIQKNEVLEKKFYLVIPFSMMQVGARGTLVGFSKKQKGASFSKKYILEQAQTELRPKRDHLLKQLARLGLRAHQLENHELIELFYDIYNPQEVGLQKITKEAGSYTTPVIEPLIAGQKKEGALSPQPEEPPFQPTKKLTVDLQDSLTQKLENIPQEETAPAPQTPPSTFQPDPQTAAAPSPEQTEIRNPNEVGDLQNAVSRASQLLEQSAAGGQKQ